MCSVASCSNTDSISIINDLSSRGKVVHGEQQAVDRRKVRTLFHPQSILEWVPETF